MSQPRRRTRDRPSTAATGGRPRPADTQQHAHAWLSFAGLVAITFIAYAPAWHGTPLWDDDAHLTSLELQSIDGLWRIWFEIGATQQYYPLTHTAFWLLHAAFGDTTTVYHLVTIALHAVSACLLVLLAGRLGLPGAWPMAAVFALHPIQVESVAWMTELKNTLSGVLYLGAALAYLRFDNRGERGPYVAALLLFCLGLLSKTVVSTLPASLLVLAWWQRGRIIWRRDVLPLLPFLGLGALAAATTAWVERAFVGATAAEYGLSALERFVLAGRALWFYLRQLSWPTDLIFTYPRWSIDASGPQLLYPLGWIAAATACWAMRRSSRTPFALVALFTIALSPALGFVNVYPFRYSFVADHFAYLAVIPFAAGVGAVVAAAASRLRTPAAQLAAAVVSVLVLAPAVWHYSSFYASAPPLYEETIRRNPGGYMAHANLGLIYLEGSPDERARALGHLRRAAELAPANPDVLANLGAGLLRSGLTSEAVNVLSQAVRLAPEHASAHNNLAAALDREGRLAEAADAYLVALRLSPASAEIRINLARVEYRRGIAEASEGNLVAAVEAYAAAVEHGLRSAELHNDWGVALARLGRITEAAAHFREAVQLDPGFETARANLAAASDVVGTR